MSRRNIPFILVALSLVLPLQAVAADGWLKAVHGIDGRDLGAQKGFLVDIAVNGGCAIPNFKFGEITDYIALPAGNYRVEISPADGACGQSAVLSANIKIRSGQYTTAVAHLDTGGSPTASVFKDNLSQARAKYGRLTVRHTAAAPTVDVTVSPKKGRTTNFTFSGVSNGQQGHATFFNKTYWARIYPYLGSEFVAGPVAAPVEAGANLFVYAVGSLSGSTFTVLVDAEPLESH